MQYTCHAFEVQPRHLCAESTTSQLDLQNERFAQQQQPLCDLFSKLDITTVNEFASLVQLKSGTGNTDCFGFVDGGGVS
jgi:hypothetical protein